MKLAVSELSPCLLHAEQNKTKGMKETSKSSANTGRQTELYEQWIFEGIECSNCQLLHAILELFREEMNMVDCEISSLEHPI